MTYGDILFKRSVELLVGRPGENARIWDNVAIDTATGFRQQGLTIDFKIDKSAKRKPNAIDITVNNLSPDSRSFVERDDSIVILRAGYGDTPPAIIASGDISSVTHERKGAEWITKIYAGDGGLSFEQARLNQAFEGGTTNLQVLQRCVTELGLPIGFIADVPTIEYTQGYHAVGPVRDILDEITGSVDYDWSVQDGQLEVTGRDEGTNLPVVVLDYTSGLVGVPRKRKSKGKKASRSRGVKAVSLLNPLIKIKGYVNIISETMTGFYLVKKVVHRGQSRGNNFYTEFEATEVQGATIDTLSTLTLTPGTLEDTAWWGRLQQVT